MKKLIILALLALPLIVSAAENTKPVGYYKAGEFNVSVFGGVTTPDFDADRGSIGVSAGYFLTENVGVEMEGLSGDTDGLFIDQAAVQLVYRIPIKRSAPYLFGGGYHTFADKEWGLSAGLGIQHRFTKSIGLFTDVRIEKFLDSGDPSARLRGGIVFAF